ncbi:MULTISPECIES: efflux RND transporter permease subunit [unclassified Azospirillum]|uniref:efflux RND transporter permease subunit n=1 Tax=unclassified Azospirillum TaxID=2630922 RepID=UPI000B6C8467|nr:MULTISPECIES: efflux RND transporter permease subunit [unclassified Azospirillum]SNS13941.1 hydrophobic/amphiphilic exporter-1, HAE1 family [Azospirillum sp. RU38E]SNS31093.1 hydrophobic/amphiphilic exporter-1, HAE1 family [Azospirillum sp. RU37A]
MSMPISTWAIRNPIPPIVLFLVLTVAGLIAFRQLPVTNMPNAVVPVVSVIINQPGASPSEIEIQITRRVEGALAGLSGVKHITSTIAEGSSITNVEFHLGTDYDRATNDSRDALASIRDQLPRSILEPQVRREEADGGAIFSFGVEAPTMRPEELSWFVDDTVNRRLLAVPGVAKVQRNGGINHEVTVTLDPARLAAFGVSAADISRQLAQTNIDLPGGRLVQEGTEYSLRTLGGVQSVKALRQTWINLGNGRGVRLGEIATVTDGGAEPRSITTLNGKPAVTFAVFRAKGASELTVGAAVREALADIAANNKAVTFTELFSLVDFTQTSFSSTLYTFFEGAVLTILTVFLFLRDGRSTALAAITIPLSIIPTFLALYFLGYSLNLVSLMAISLVTGVLVDDAIVEIENIHRHMADDPTKKPYDAAIIAADEIGLAVVATTAVICAVFMPVSFMGGVVGQFFVQFGVTVAVAAFFSLVVARLLTPMLAAYLLRAPATHQGPAEGRWGARYRRLVEWTLDHRAVTLLIAAASVALSFGMIPLLSTGYLPYEDYSQSTLTIELPRGSTLAQTDATAQRMADILRERPETLYVLTNAGGEQGVNVANLQIKLSPPKERDVSQREFEALVLPALSVVPDVRARFSNSSGGKDISIILTSEDTQALERTAKAVERGMRGIDGINSVGSTAPVSQPEIVITPDFAKAAQLGISVQALSDAVNIATIGDTDANLAKFNHDGRQLVVRVRLAAAPETTLETVRELRVPTAGGGSVPLSAVASIRFGAGPASIERYDRRRKIAVEANVDGLSLGDALEMIHDLPAMENLPRSVDVRNGGDGEEMTDLFNRFLEAIAAGLMLVYVIQVLLYKDWIQPLTRMAALPLSIGGAFLALLLTNTDLNMSAAIGILMLMGIADKNSILLVDYMVERIRNGVDRRQAIVESCTVRARPIIMTSLAMLAGMLPIALGIGLDTAFREPMAIAVIGGLISSTALSLIFVPVLFDYVRDAEDWLVPRLRRLL